MKYGKLGIVNAVLDAAEKFPNDKNISTAACAVIGRLCYENQENCDQFGEKGCCVVMGALGLFSKDEVAVISCLDTIASLASSQPAYRNTLREAPHNAAQVIGKCKARYKENSLVQLHAEKAMCALELDCKNDSEEESK